MHMTPSPPSPSDVSTHRRTHALALLFLSKFSLRCAGERNFHVFYLFFAGVIDKEEYGLGDPMEHRLINSNEAAVDEIEEPKTMQMWAELTSCFDVVGFSAEETKQFYHILAGILHLGDMEMGGGNDSAYIVSGEDSIRKVADNLGVRVDTFQEALVVQTITTRGEAVSRHYNQVCVCVCVCERCVCACVRVCVCVCVCVLWLLINIAVLL
jgi:myosin heavy subunit